jgi:hypothetical protein
MTMQKDLQVQTQMYQHLVPEGLSCAFAAWLTHPQLHPILQPVWLKENVALVTLYQGKFGQT